MKRAFTMFLAIGVTMVFTWGCKEEQASSDVKMSRLIAAENRDLKAQLQQETTKRDEEIRNLKIQLQTETKKRDDEIENFAKQLAQCEQDRQATLDKTEKDIQSFSEEITEKTIIPLIKEMGDLKTEISRLKAELASCRKEKNAPQ